MNSAGSRSRDPAPLCWSQRHLWLAHEHLPPHARTEYTIPLRLPVPPEATEDSLRRVLDLLVRRHEGLRTTIEAGDDGLPRQRVHPVGPAPLEVVRLSSGQVPATPPAVVAARVTDTPFDLAEQWPIRALVVVEDATPIMLLLVVHHTAMDDWAINRVHDELRTLHDAVAADRPASLAPVRHRPVDLARHEASPASAPVNDRALAHWDATLATVPAHPLGRDRVPAGDEPVARGASLCSPAAASAARVVAARLGVWPSVLYTAVCLGLLAAWAGSDEVVFRTFAANRNTDLQAEVVSSLSQPVPVHADGLAGVSLRRLVARVSEAMTDALEHSYCAHDQAVALVERHSRTRGIGIRLGTSVNYLSYAPRSCGVRRSTFTWHRPPERWALDTDEVSFRVHEYADGVVLALNARSTAMAKDDVERLLRAAERVLVAAADGDLDGDLDGAAIAELAGFGRAPVPPAAVDHTPVDVDAVAAHLVSHPEVAAVHVSRRGSPARIVAHVAGGPGADPGTLRAHVLAAVHRDPWLRTPDVFHRHASPPDDADDPDAWERLPVVEEGDGTVARVRPPRGPAEEALAGAIRAVDRTGPVSMTDTYLQAGGRVLAVPRLRAVLAERGWCAPRVLDLVGARPLAALAAEMTTV